MENSKKFKISIQPQSFFVTQVQAGVPPAELDEGPSRAESSWAPHGVLQGQQSRCEDHEGDRGAAGRPQRGQVTKERSE